MIANSEVTAGRLDLPTAPPALSCVLARQYCLAVVGLFGGWGLSD